MPALRNAPAPRKAHLALFDATTLVAKGIKDRLVDRAFPIASVRLYTSSDDPDANLTEFAGEAMLVSRPDIEALGSIDLAFFCGTRHEGERYLDWPAHKGFVGIDLTSASQGRSAVPVINAAVNPEALPRGPGLVAAPRPIGLLLSTVLAAIERKCGLKEAAAVVLQPVSECGEPGIGELYKQTLGLLNFQDMPREVFGRQVAFNLVPDFAYGTAGTPGTGPTDEIESEIRRITGGSAALSVAVVLAPVFHCHSAMLRVVLPKGRGRADLLEALTASGDIRVGGGDGPATPVERAGEAGVLVSGIRPAGREGAFWLWLLSDNLTSGASLNAVRIAETVWARTGGRPKEA
jgi:aspartate-semialdehyde dehydrogenase